MDWILVALATLIRECARKWLQRRENSKRWKELTKTARQNHLQSEIYRQEFWKEWSKLNIAGRDAYYRGDYAAANRLFEGLLGVAEKFDAYRFGMKEKLGLYHLDSLPRDVGESCCWWQANIVREGTLYWNTWRRANPEVTPDLRNQSLRNHRNLNGFDFSGADLTAANFAGSQLERTDFRGANLAGAGLFECCLQGANLRGANLTGANLEGADLTAVEGLTDHQLASALGDMETKLPASLVRPGNWGLR